ncbi:MAG: hypothetical protein NTV22_11440 [bacterium]|nr:hypothetical protein [bacterium]
MSKNIEVKVTGDTKELVIREGSALLLKEPVAAHRLNGLASAWTRSILNAAMCWLTASAARSAWCSTRAVRMQRK